MAESTGEKPWYLTEVQGIQCILFHHQPSPDERKERKRLKDELGSLFKDTPILDMKTTSSGKELCNAILYTNNIEKWENSFTNFYKGNKYTNIASYIQGGYQWKQSGNTMITMSFYTTGQHKIMIQPGKLSINAWLETVSKVSNMSDIVDNVSMVQSLEGRDVDKGHDTHHDQVAGHD